MACLFGNAVAVPVPRSQPVSLRFTQGIAVTITIAPSVLDSEHLGPGELDRLMTRIGSSTNGSTSRDRTNYF